MDILITFARDFGFPVAVAAFVLLRLDRRLAHVEESLVRICAILSATTGVRVEDLDVDLAARASEPVTVEPVPQVGNAAAGAAKQGG